MTLATRPLRLATLAFALSLGLAACGGDGSLPAADTSASVPAADVAPPGDKVAALFAADEAARSSGGEVQQVVTSYADVRQKVLIAASDGRLAEDDRTRVRFAVQVVAGRDGRITTGFEAPNAFPLPNGSS